MAEQPLSPEVAARSSARSASAKDRLATLFPDPSSRKRPRWRNRKARLAVVVVVVVALIGGTAMVAGALGSSGPDYRTALVQNHAVDSQVTGVATIEPISQAAIAFPVAGTVSSVAVNVGDAVGTGEPLATLDTAALTVALHEKQAALASAQLVLSKALAGESVTGLTGSGSSPTGASARTTAYSTGSTKVLTAALAADGTTPPGPAAGAGTGGAGPSGTGTSAPSSTDTDLAAAQQAVLTAQKNVDAALASANTALASAASVCAAAGVSSTSSTGTATTTPPATTAAPPTGTTSTPSTTPTPEQLAACQTATKAVLTAQTAVSAAQTSLAGASSALDNLLAQRAAAATTTTPPTTAPASPSTGSRSGSGATGGTGATGGSGATGSGSTTTSPSAADLVKYQKAVDAAESDVAVAEQAIAQATIVSPIAGTVVGVSVKVGQAVTAGSSTANVVVKGSDGYEVSTTVTVANVASVKVGQTASLIPDGSHQAIEGKVTSISVAPESDSTTTSYRIVIGLTGDTSHLQNGATGSVAITTEQTASALAVPTSAITTAGTQHTVTVVNGGKATVTTVRVGVVGDTWTQIMSGVTKGQTVALADIAKALPGSATTATTSATNGRFGGVNGLPPGFTPGAGGFRQFTKTG